jgi:hypothetical protein
VSTDKPIPISDKRAKLMRHRWLWSVVILCLLLWGIKAGHRAMQPQYEGKTAEEWFEANQIFMICGTGQPPPPDQKNQRELRKNRLLPFQVLGPDALEFLWHEYTHPPSRPSSSQSSSPFGPNRHLSAFVLLHELGPEARPLIPKILPAMLATESENSSHMAMLLGNIHEQPALVVPALIRALESTNWAHCDKAAYADALAAYGQAAQPALPALRKCLTDPSTPAAVKDQLASSILRITGPGPELDILTQPLVLTEEKNWSSRNISMVLYLLKKTGTNAAPAVPTLQKFARTLTGEWQVEQVMETIKIIDPEGVYAKP